MTPEQEKLLIDKTKDQSMSNIWFEQGKDRITASLFYLFIYLFIYFI